MPGREAPTPARWRAWGMREGWRGCCLDAATVSVARRVGSVTSVPATTRACGTALPRSFCCCCTAMAARTPALVGRGALQILGEVSASGLRLGVAGCELALSSRMRAMCENEPGRAPADHCRPPVGLGAEGGLVGTRVALACVGKSAGMLKSASTQQRLRPIGVVEWTALSSWEKKTKAPWAPLRHRQGEENVSPERHYAPVPVTTSRPPYTERPPSPHTRLDLTVVTAR